MCKSSQNDRNVQHSEFDSRLSCHCSTRGSRGHPPPGRYKLRSAQSQETASDGSRNVCGLVEGSVGLEIKMTV